MHTHMHTHIDTYRHICTHACIHTYTHMHTYIHCTCSENVSLIAIIWVGTIYMNSLCIVDYCRDHNRSSDVASSMDASSWNSSLRSALKYRGSRNKTIIISLVDLGSYEMTINFHETSLLKHGIHSYLFLSTNTKMCQLLNAKSIACLPYGSDAASDRKSIYGSKEFIRKMNVRTYMILEVLQLGYNVLHTDVDVIFLRNPLLDLSCFNGTFDVAIMWDSNSYNAGFLFIRSTPASIKLYKDMRKTAETTGKDDQVALNEAIQKLKGHLKLVKLSPDKYSCGKHFYEDPGLHFGDHPSLRHTPTVVIHNNWIISLEAKAYRFKEFLQWNYDEYRYYSSTAAKYISYENPLLIANQTVARSIEMKALQNALIIGAILNRAVILPKFHCENTLCSLLNWVKIRNFDNVFKGKYREHLFLKHPKVPKSISSSISPMFLIKNRNRFRNILPLEEFTEHEPSDEVNGPSRSEICQWYGNITQSILHFKSLYGEFKQLQTLRLGSYNTTRKAFEAAFVKSKYRQL